MKVSFSKSISTGSDDTDVKLFHFTYDNIIMGEKDEDARAARFFAYFAEQARMAYW